MAAPLPLGTADPARLGEYEILGRLGTGGQGAVYLGRKDPDPTRVAIKLLHTRLLGSPDARARFVRELALLQRVAGFCTAQMLEADLDGDRPYIVSEYVPGPSLRELVENSGPRTGADLDRLAIGSVTALTAIHRAGIVHRDFKPQNVLMGPDGPRVIDFGIARALDSGSTLTSQVIGTPAYMAPEQFAAAMIGPSADLFAWAATLLYAATGRDPFAGGPLPAVMYRVMNETPDLSPLPAALAEVAAACLSKDPADRPTSEQALLWLLGDRTRPSKPPTPEQVPSTNPDQSPPPEQPFVPPQPPFGAQTLPGPPPFGSAPPPVAPGPAWQPEPRRYRRLPRSIAVITGLSLAALLAALDVAALAVLIADPSLSDGKRGGLLPVVASSFAVLAVVTLVAVILAWRGSRAAAWTIMAARVLRVVLWGGWALLVTVQPAPFALHTVLTALVVLLLARGLTRPP
ncbi:serine/threonine-protein kinase [Spirillospora sp. CA-294931]|uniref:serine/threonine-protein kinase n=1 Tax=Spirillospora sp. CA-294931 TaxID=3240042 RepID=UPI003D9373ED